jgi:exodeoxyribonuclease-3
MKLVSWNVNGLRAVLKKGFMEWFLSSKADMVCLQETKMSEAQLPPELKEIEGYHSFFAEAEKKGYSGVALFSKEKPKSITRELGIKRFDGEGRMIRADYNDFILFNVYFPNGKASKERLQFKMDFYEAFLATINDLKKKGKRLIICGDMNTAHKEIDLARPKENETVSGFLPEEREWIDRMITSGFIDTFRLFVKEGGRYSWWDYKTRARERNIGWRIDYFFISENLKKSIIKASIESAVMGSDHCPISIEMKF